MTRGAGFAAPEAAPPSRRTARHASDPSAERKTAFGRWRRDFLRSGSPSGPGCGTGYGSRILAEAGARQVLGVDIDPLRIACSRRLSLASRPTAWTVMPPTRTRSPLSPNVRRRPDISTHPRSHVRQFLLVPALSLFSAFPVPVAAQGVSEPAQVHQQLREDAALARTSSLLIAST